MDPDESPAGAVKLPPRYCSAAGRHRHKCAGCGCVWEHDDACRDLPPAEHHAAHACPKCGREATDWYLGRGAPEVRDHHKK